MDWGALISFVGPGLRAHLLTTRKRVVVLPAAVVRSPRAALAGRPLPAQYDRSADATGGLCIERICVDALGAWGPSATNKLHRIYTGALFATTIKAYK